jgi:hypothetical protein
MDWNKAAAIAGVGTFVLTIIIVGLMLWPTAPDAIRHNVGAAPIVSLALCIFGAAWLHLKAARVGARNRERHAVLKTSDSPIAVATNAFFGNKFPVDTSPPKSPSPSATEPVFLDLSPTQLVEPYGHLTDYHASKIVAGYIAKWVRWTAKVDNVSMVGERACVATDLGHPTLFLSFYFVPSENEKVLVLRKGTTVTIEGRVRKVTRFYIDIEDWVLKEVLPAAISGSDQRSKTSPP